MLDRTQPPSFVAPHLLEVTLPTYKKNILDNGVNCYFLEDKKLNVFQIEFVFLAGNCFHSQKLIASFTNSLLNNGTKQKTALQIEEFLEARGAFLKTHCSYEIASITVSGLSEYFEELMLLLKELFTESVFTEKEITIHQENNIQQLKLQLEKSEFLADRKMNEVLYGKNHVYGKFAEIEDFSNIKRKDIVSFYEDYYLQSKAILFMAGAFPENNQSLLNKIFGQLLWKPLQKSDIPYFEKHSSTNNKFDITNNLDATQTSIRLGTDFIGIADVDFPKAQLLSLIFGGYFGARLMKNIREDKGYTYGIYSYIQHHFQQSAFIITSEVGKDVCQLAIDEIYKEIEKLYTTKIEDDELIEAKNYIVGSLVNDMENVFMIMNKWKTFILNNLSDDFFDILVSNIKTISSNDLLFFAEKHFKDKVFKEVHVS